MNKRRAHRKSRGGCTECKRRHIKCDEEKPSCLHCTRHSTPCIYRQNPTIVRDASPGDESSPHSDCSWQFIGSDDYAHASPHVTSAPTNAPNQLFQMRDMALLHHWITVAGYSILDTHDLDHYWHSVIPSIGFKHQYVMHSILSLSALHMAHANPLKNDYFLKIAADHRSKALDQFTDALHDVGPHNSSALFANASLTFFYAFASFSSTCDDGDTSTNARTARILGAEWIPLARGISAVLNPVYQYIQEGPLRAFLEVHDFYQHEQAEITSFSAYGKHLLEAQSLWAADEHADTYDEALRILLRCSTWMKQFDSMESSVKANWGYNRFCSGPFIWLLSTPEKYFTLQQQRQPPALIIFAYYGVMLHQINNYWWSENCGRNIISAVDMCLGPYWSSWLDWPRQTVGL